MSRPRGRTPSERRWAMDGPSARAVGQTGEPREPDVGGRTSGGIRPLVTLGLSKVTRQAAQRRRNPVEDGVLVFCMAKPCQYLVSGQRRYRPPLTLALSRKGRGNGDRGRLRFANRPYRTHANGLATPHALPHGERGRLPWCNALRLLHPTAYPQGEGIVAADDYASLIDPIRPD